MTRHRLTKWRKRLELLQSDKRTSEDKMSATYDAGQWYSCAIGERLELEHLVIADDDSALLILTNQAFVFGVDFAIEIRDTRYDEAYKILEQIELMDLDNIIKNRLHPDLKIIT